MKEAKRAYDANLASLRDALEMFFALGLEIPAIERTIDENMPIAAAGLGETTMQRVVGVLVAEAYKKNKNAIDMIVDTGKEIKAPNHYDPNDAPDIPAYEYPEPPAKLASELAKYGKARTEETATLIPNILKGVDSYGHLFEKHADPEILEKIKSLTKHVPQNVKQGDQKLPATSENLAEITKDPDAPENTRSLEYILHARRVAAPASILLYKTVSKVVDDVGVGSTTPGGLKKVARLVFKTMLNYGGDFARCRDISRCTVEVDDLESVFKVAEALIACESLVVVRMKNRFDPEFDSAPIGGYRDLQFLCLIQTEDGVWRYGEVQVNLKDFVQLKAGIDPETGEKWADEKSDKHAVRGHNAFNKARATETYSESTYLYVGGSSEELWRNVEAGMILEVDLRSQADEGSARHHLEAMKRALMSDDQS